MTTTTNTTTTQTGSIFSRLLQLKENGYKAIEQKKSFNYSQYMKDIVTSEATPLKISQLLELNDEIELEKFYNQIFVSHIFDKETEYIWGLNDVKRLIPFTRLYYLGLFHYFKCLSEYVKSKNPPKEKERYNDPFSLVKTWTLAIADNLFQRYVDGTELDQTESSADMMLALKKGIEIDKEKAVKIRPSILQKMYGENQSPHLGLFLLPMYAIMNDLFDDDGKVISTTIQQLLKLVAAKQEAQKAWYERTFGKKDKEIREKKKRPDDNIMTQTRQKMRKKRLFDVTELN